VISRRRLTFSRVQPTILIDINRNKTNKFRPRYEFLSNKQHGTLGTILFVNRRRVVWAYIELSRITDLCQSPSNGRRCSRQPIRYKYTWPDGGLFGVSNDCMLAAMKGHVSTLSFRLDRAQRGIRRACLSAADHELYAECIHSMEHRVDVCSSILQVLCGDQLDYEKAPLSGMSSEEGLKLE